MSWRRLFRATTVATGLALASAALAHETLHEVERGRAIAVKAYFADGEVLAYTPYEVYSPVDPRIPWQKGRTDRAGWLAFVPDAPGKWRVKVVEETGHGLDLEVDASLQAGAPGAGAPSALAFALRPLLGVAAVAALFGLLFWLQRRRGAP